MRPTLSTSQNMQRRCTRNPALIDRSSKLDLFRTNLHSLLREHLLKRSFRHNASLKQHWLTLKGPKVLFGEQLQYVTDRGNPSVYLEPTMCSSWSIVRTHRPTDDTLRSRDACSDSIAKYFGACFVGYRTIIARYVAKRKGGIAPFWGAATSLKSIARYGVSQGYYRTSARYGATKMGTLAA